ncbi:MAG: hypothetical protein Q4G50_03460 [Corynebacterium sp.]|uniref:hypothetical protein n=1 Tax=Corynebacterium sp. TaxID=1720 RepID=UPI0026E0AC75|nr:hypothetical protein [Corynebacterium sp.]MDO5669041.1 hypothetical protein [Corynebacterium sp.]
MVWIVYGAAFAVVVAVFALAPRTGGGRGFPWFWVVFPLSMLAIGASIMFWADFGPQTFDVFGGPGYDYFFFWNLAATAWPILALLGAGLSFWAWRKGWR